MLATSFTATAVEVEMESRPINLQNSLIKWFLILNSKPSALSPKLTLATVAEEDMGDYAYLLEVNRELRRDKNFDSIPVELAVITSPEQKQRFYKYFQETSELKIHWILDEESEDQFANQELNNSSLVFFLSSWPELNGPITPNWLNITHYTSLPDWDQSLYDYVMSLGQQAEDYYQAANISTQSSTCLRRREGEEESEIIDWERLTEQLDSDEFSCDLYQSQENCLNRITFGLSEKTVGLPFNSLLSEKVNEFEQSPDKSDTRMARDFNALLKEKLWLGEALSGKKPAFNPFEAIRQSPYYIAYYHGQAFLKEYLAIISQIDDSIPTIVLNISLEQLQSSAYHGMFADLGYGKVTFQSETETVSYPIPEALSYKQIKIVNPEYFPIEK
ncbi:hypothetical protein [Endozoicomonas arenosclerae]|uniref:hypothetical protein n=1 Tax=Endozoicomonas arenosclerae TaxID=1633495 RepID=UPI0012946DB5|nr:hypothetical protein [Endozoicomonas arenosclerae]